MAPAACGRLGASRGQQGALPIDAYLEMSQDVLDLQAQLEAKMLERRQRLQVGCILVSSYASCA